MNDTNQRPNRFDAYDVALALIDALRMLMPELQRQDTSLAKQLRTAATSIALNVAEGCRRLGRDRRYHYTVAAGSTDEVRAALECAAAWGYLEAAALAPALELVDRELAMLYRLTH